MSTHQENSNAHEAESSWSGHNGQEKSQPFRQLTAVRRCGRILRAFFQNEPERGKGIKPITAIGICYELILMTPPRGSFEATLDELESSIAVSGPPIGRAIRVMVGAGVLRVRRRGSVANVYTWTELAYRSSLTPENTRFSESPGGDGVGAGGPPVVLAQAVFRSVLSRYLKLREKRYGVVLANGYRMRDTQAMTAGQAREAIEERIAALAMHYRDDDEDPLDAVDRIADKALELWFARPGRPGTTWLRDHQHPLERLAPDLDWLCEQFKVLYRPAAQAPERAAAPEEPRRLTNSDVAEFARRSRELVGAIGAVGGRAA